MKISLNTLQETQAIAQKIASCLVAGVAITFNGELGVGKTTLIRYILKDLGLEGNIKSPTYTLVEPYHIKGIDINHFDLYRFNDKYEWLESGFDEYFTQNSICLIEWPSKANGLIPVVDWSINITFHEENRIIEIIPITTKGKECLLKVK
ncbi:MAG: tRNA (adenosine(37)-N6)-threonylcarbamoyltransferase complex ATPase subunit type 1 TsaE [Burkholderiales bacterium]|nr:tRNA (adenosine(37)-N6)-threonylcarbamoyltransferase complex ATPase subunit type 1 TsaE [Burkholderiales bacterium]